MAEKILDSLRSRGVLSDSLQEKLSQIVPDDAKDKLSGFLQRYQELDDEGKEEVMNTVFGKLKEKFQGNLQSNPNFFTQLLFNNSYTVFFVALLLIVLVVGTSLEHQSHTEIISLFSISSFTIKR